MPLGVLRALPYIRDMSLRIHRRSLVLLAALGAAFPWRARAEEDLSAGTEAEVAPFGPVPARDVVEADLVYVKRPVIVFADTPNDPNFIRQMELLPRVYDDLALRRVILITDTDPADPSALRRRLRPRGFSLILMDRDWGSAIRKPLPWEGREIVNAIDKMPLARSDALERSPAGR
ncbi:DUF4174 domain-containing protein [Pseudogemmobacter sonorensis]|uniref:DUF4174 domain-containing protein n=1 Tax=Pseudogemmobacter sonorensis TaxID=2989681 RepID=UPI0036777251